MEISIIKGERLRNEQFIELSFADGALVVFHDEAESEDARVAHVLVVALAQRVELHVVETQNAVVRVPQVRLPHLVQVLDLLVSEFFFYIFRFH